MKDTNRARIVRRYERVLPAVPERVFPLLCPVREYEWVQGWRCELLFSASGVIEEGCVFRTDTSEPGGPDIWVTSRHEPPRLVQFVRGNTDRTMRYTIRLEPHGDGQSRIEWEQEVTALTDRGDAAVAERTEARYAEEMTRLNDALVHFLRTGEMMPLRP